MKKSIFTITAFLSLNSFSAKANELPNGSFKTDYIDFSSEEGQLISADFLNHKITQNDRITVSNDGHLQVNNKRFRIFGTNLSEFPSEKTAEYCAQLLSDQGYNCIRFHHTDAEWTNCFIKRLDNGKNVLNKQKLDDFDWFFAKLKEKGIYSNINFLTGRNISSLDGYKPEIDKISNWKHKHCLGFWNEEAQNHQKQYISELLNHENPYTKIKYKDDAAVAIVEINNENGLIMGYLSGWLEDFYGGEYWQELEEKWNLYLKQNNYSYEQLNKIFNKNSPIKQELISKNSVWQLEQHEGAKAQVTKKNDVSVVKIQKNGKENWHIQYNTAQLSLNENSIYTLKFSAKSNKNQKISVDLMQAHKPWKNSGFSAQLELTPKYQDFVFTFLPNSTDENLRINFGNMGLSEGTEIFIKDVLLQEGGNIENVKKSPFNKNNVKFPTFAEYKYVPNEYKNIVLSFLYDLEEKYWVSMRDFIRNEVGSKSLIMGTVNSCSTPVLQNCFDIIDSHAYWNHPVFPNKDWDKSDFYVKNSSLTKANSDNTLINLAKQRIYGKPFSVTEYDHPYPNQFSAEMYAMYAVFASFQDWDCIYTFCYELPKTKNSPLKINGFFDQGNDVAKVFAAPFAARIFRNALVKPAEKNFYITLNKNTEKSLLYKNVAWNIGNPQMFGSIPGLSLSHKIGIIIPENNFKIDNSFTDMKTLNESDYSRNKIFSDTQELYWDNKSGVFIACNENISVTVSHSDSVLPDFPEKWLKNGTILPLQENSDFAGVIAIKENNNVLIYNCSRRGNKNENLREYKTNKKDDLYNENIFLTTDANHGTSPVYATSTDGFLQIFGGKKIILKKNNGSLWNVQKLK